MSSKHTEYGPCACAACKGQIDSNSADTSDGERAPQMAPTYDNNEVIGQIVSGAKWSGSNITYGFLQSSPSWDIGYEGDGFQEFTSAQKAATRSVMSLWDDVVAPSFTEKTSNEQNANVKFGNTDTSINYAHAYYPGSYNWAGEVWLNAPTYNGLYNPDPGDYYFMTILHEVGHAIGLSHPGAYNGGSPTYANNAEYAQDTHQWTVMSYFSASNTGADWNGGSGWQYAQTPMVHDILAAQAIYGADTTTRTGDTTYGFNSNAGHAVYDFSQNSSPVLSIYDAGGTDTLDLSGFSQRAIIDLEPGTYSSAGGTTSSMKFNIGIANGTWIENAIGGSGNDTIRGNVLDNELSGNGGDDHLYGYDGNDTLSGGGGTDWAYFSLAIADYSFKVFSTTIQVIGDFVDTVLNDIEWLSFSDTTTSYADLEAQWTSTEYTNGADSIVLSSNGANVSMLAGDDVVSYTDGFVRVNGGSGSDTIDFSGFASAIGVKLYDSGYEVHTRDAKHVDSGTKRYIADLTDVENVVGTAFNDKLYGDDADNTFTYVEGRDKIRGYDGTDTADFSNFDAAIKVNLNSSKYEVTTRDKTDLNSGSKRNIADLRDVENIIGTDHHDKLYGDDADNLLIGNDGDDIFKG
ncbi:MAG: M10 family metallopeptidase, partial [Pseudomonadota bacterium]